MTSNSILPSTPAQDEAKATEWSWQQTLDRLNRRGEVKISEIEVPQRLLDLGLDVTFRFGLMVKESNTPARREVDHALLAEIIDNPEHSGEYIAARVNSIFDNREVTGKDRKPISLTTLVGILNGLEDDTTGAVATDHSDKSIYRTSRARVKLVSALLESFSARKDLLTETESAVVLDPKITALVMQYSDRVDALIELIRDRHMRDLEDIEEMMDESDANRFMEGAL